AREPELADLISRIVVRGGSVKCIGDATPCAEQNIYADPVAAKEILRSQITKTLIPLDVTDQVVWTLDLLEKLPSEETRAGKLLRATIPYLFRSHRQHLGLESIRLPDAVCICALLHPELFHTEELAGDIETGGEITVGATIFDRRPLSPHRRHIDVLLESDDRGV